MKYEAERKIKTDSFAASAASLYIQAAEGKIKALMENWDGETDLLNICSISSFVLTSWCPIFILFFYTGSIFSRPIKAAFKEKIPNFVVIPKNKFLKLVGFTIYQCSDKN